MITSILQEPNSPTLGYARDLTRNVINSTIYDDMEKDFPIQITYCYADKLFGIVVTEFDYKLCPDACISKRDTEELIKDIIREEHCGLVEFF
jgi:hypothetical protein